MLVRADAADALEGGAQRVRGAVADRAGHRGDSLPRVEDEAGGNLVRVATSGPAFGLLAWALVPCGRANP